MTPTHDVTNLSKTAALSPETDRADLIVWDSTPAGLISAIAAARSGLSVIVVTEDHHVGGLQTSGLGFTNAGQRATVGGLAREFHDRIRGFYGDTYGADSAQVEACSEGFFFEPHVAESVYLDWLAEVGVGVVTAEILSSVDRLGNRLTALCTESGRVFRGRVFIDASYEGDLIALAGCSFHLGRESRAAYGEKLAGATYPPESEGMGDHKLQPFDYRCCLTDDPDNRVPFHEPANYDPANYAWQQYRMRQRPPQIIRDVLPLNLMPNRKTDSRMAEWPGRSWDYIEADRAGRRAIEVAHRQHSAGYLWFAMNDPSIPAAIRAEIAGWGLAADEFTDNGNWPHHIYVREGRRLQGDYVMTEKDCLLDRFKPDSIGLCSWYMDVHPVDLVVDHEVYHEDGFIVLPLKPYEIPLRSLLPRGDECDNLMAPVPLSASHVAFSSIRVEPVWMILGHACGLAASLALELDAPVQGLPVDELRKRLIAQKQLLDARPFNEVWPTKRK